MNESQVSIIASLLARICLISRIHGKVQLVIWQDMEPELTSSDLSVNAVPFKSSRVHDAWLNFKRH